MIRDSETKAIFFDLDGTIVDSRAAYLEAARTGFAAFGQKIASERIVLMIPKMLEQKLPIGDLLNEINVPEFLDIYLRTYYQVTLTKSKPFSGVEQTLMRLSEKARLALITMRHVPKRKIIEELETFKLARFFQYVITALDTLNSKPSPEALIKCAAHFGIQMDQCVFVGDSVTDVRAGKAAGAKTVAVLSGIYGYEELKHEKPNLILESVNNLPNCLELLGKQAMHISGWKPDGK